VGEHLQLSPVRAERPKLRAMVAKVLTHRAKCWLDEGEWEEAAAGATAALGALWAGQGGGGPAMLAWEVMILRIRQLCNDQLKRCPPPQ
jgi:hypothetical protein